MSLNGVNTGYSTYETSNVTASGSKVSGKTDKSSVSDNATYNDVAATYEHSSANNTSAVSKKASNAAVVAQLKADQETRMAQMQSLVTKMFSKQGITIGTADDMWKALAGGNFTADADTIAQAKEDISEDGYWGVKQTSERILDFAKALTGGDASKVEEMRKAIEKGFSQAAKLWGDELPEISQKTHEAVMKGLDEWAKESSAQ